MASLERKGTGWRVRWREGGRGSPLQRSATYPTKTLAQEAADRIEAELAASKNVHRGELLALETIFIRWRTDRIAAGNDPTWTAQAERYCKKMADSQGWKTTQDVTPEAVSRWRQGGSRARSGAELRAVLRWAADVLCQPVDPRTLVRLRPPRARRKAPTDLLTDEQVAKWQAQADAISPAAGALIHCLATYGWRPITAARLSVGDVDIARGTIRTEVKASSGQDEHRHPLTSPTIARLRPLLDRPAGAPLFTNPHSGLRFPIDSNGVPYWFRKTFRAGVYDLKRYAISRMLARGLPPQTVALFTGHRTLSQVLRYARTNEDTARAALAALT